MGLGQNPILKIGGVPLDCKAFTWTMLSGPSPNRERFEVSNFVADQLVRLKNPVYILFDFPIGRYDKIENYIARFENLYLTEQKSAGNYTQVWEIADSRMFWEGLKVSRMYNISWGGYDQKQLQPELELQFANFTKVQAVRYAPWSLKRPGEIAFLLPDDTSGSPGEVWTAKQILLDILLNVLGVQNLADTLKDNGFQPENLIFDMEDVSSALRGILQEAHGNLYQRPDGKLELFPLYGADINIDLILNDFGLVDGSEVPFKQDLSRIRPGKIRVGFEKEYEILFKYEETAASVKTVLRNATPDLDLENVLQIPDTFVAGGKKYVEGSWMPVFQALALWNADTVNPPPSKKALTKADILRFWCSPNYLEWAYGTFVLGTGVYRHDEIWSNRISALRAHFRKTFRISQYWSQRLLKLEASRATLLDPITGRKSPSLVWMDYTHVATHRLLIKSKNPDAHVAAKVIERYPADGRFSATKPVPAYINMLDERLGIFEVDFLQDPLFFTMKYIYGAVDPVPKAAAGLGQDLTVWSSVSLKADFKLAVVLSCIFAVPNSKENKLWYEFEDETGAKDRIYEIYSLRDNARYGAGDNMSVVFSPGDGSMRVSGATLSNENIVSAIAQAEKEMLAWSWKDRTHVGTFTAPGWKDTWLPTSWIQSVSVQFDQSFGLATVISMPEPPASKPLLSQLGPKVRHILQKSVRSREGI